MIACKACDGTGSRDGFTAAECVKLYATFDRCEECKGSGEISEERAAELAYLASLENGGES